MASAREKTNLIQTALSWLRRQQRLSFNCSSIESLLHVRTLCVLLASGRTELQGVVTTGQTPPPPQHSPHFGRALSLTPPQKNKLKNVLKDPQTHWGRRLFDAQPPGGRFRMVKARNKTVWKKEKQLPPSGYNHHKYPMIKFHNFR